MYKNFIIYIETIKEKYRKYTIMCYNNIVNGV